MEGVNLGWWALNTINYYNFIDNIINTRGQWNNEVRKQGCSRHHIIPRSYGGLPVRLSWDHNNNVIWLTHFEHLIVHKILAYDNPEDPRACSGYVFFRKFCEKHNLEVEPIEDPALFNKIYSTGQSRPGSFNGMSGKHHSEETKSKMRVNHQYKEWTTDERIKVSVRSSKSRWYTDGTNEKFAIESPEGWHLGRKPGTGVGSKNAAAIKCYVYDESKNLVGTFGSIAEAEQSCGLKRNTAKRYTGWENGPYKGFYFIKEENG